MSGIPLVDITDGPAPAVGKALRTADRRRSTRHRVLSPQASAPDEDLVSLVFFHELDPHTVVESLGPPIGHTAAPPVRAADHLADELAAITVSP